MIEFWQSLSYVTRFSAIATVATAILGFISMGMLGGLLYYPVSFALKPFPHLNDLKGDWVWPAVIMIGMLWSLGFVWGGLSWHLLEGLINSTTVLKVIYAVILWSWALLLWYLVLSKQVSG